MQYLFWKTVIEVGDRVAGFVISADFLQHSFDYTKLKNFEEYIKDTDTVLKSMFSSTLYNLAYFSMKLGVLKEYEIKIEFDYEVE